MKRIVALLLCLAAAVSLASCGAEKEPDTQQLADESYSRALDLYSRGAYVSAGIVIDKAVEEYGPEERFEELRSQVKEAAEAALTTAPETTENSYERWLTETQPEPVTEPSTTAPTTTKPETTTKAATTTTTTKQKSTSATTTKKETTTTKPSTKQSTTASKPTTTTTTKPTTRHEAKPLTTKPKGKPTTTAPETGTTTAPATGESGSEAVTEESSEQLA